MRKGIVVCIGASALLTFSTILLAQTWTPSTRPKSQDFDPHDLSGMWLLSTRTPFKSALPEPPLTPWGKAHLFPEGITHGSEGTETSVSGGFAGQNCEPIGLPAQFSYLQLYPMEIVQLPGKMLQIFELHREWREIWMEQHHPKDLIPTYMGDSIAKWEGDTLVVDTIGYNGKDWVSEFIDHPMSDAFHLVEQYRRVSHDTLQIDMAFYDPKFWGDRAWTGFTRTLKLQPADERFVEWICVPEVDANYNEQIMGPAFRSKGLYMPKK